uniref:Uncharacterized protein n=2 Tax=Lotharella globosa TaxID=91324 RepID=A0A7S4DR42_9EUKA
MAAAAANTEKRSSSNAATPLSARLRSNRLAELCGGFDPVEDDFSSSSDPPEADPEREEDTQKKLRVSRRQQLASEREPSTTAAANRGRPRLKGDSSGSGSRSNAMRKRMVSDVLSRDSQSERVMLADPVHEDEDADGVGTVKEPTVDDDDDPLFPKRISPSPANDALSLSEHHSHDSPSTKNQHRHRYSPPKAKRRTEPLNLGGASSSAGGRRPEGIMEALIKGEDGEPLGWCALEMCVPDEQQEGASRVGYNIRPCLSEQQQKDPHSHLHANTSHLTRTHTNTHTHMQTLDRTPAPPLIYALDSGLKTLRPRAIPRDRRV